MNSVETAGLFFGEAHGFHGDNLEVCLVNAPKNLALLTATYCVGFDDCESALDGHENFLQSI
jgi:hypothetical protein